jgi:hypothetical protein
MQQPHFGQAPSHIGHVLTTKRGPLVNPTCRTKSETEHLSVKKRDPIDMNIISIYVYIYYIYYIIYYILYIIYIQELYEKEPPALHGHHPTRQKPWFFGSCGAKVATLPTDSSATASIRSGHSMPAVAYPRWKDEQKQPWFFLHRIYIYVWDSSMSYISIYIYW